MDVESFVARAGFEVVRGVEGQLHERPARKSMATFPSVRGVRSFLIGSTQPVVLQVIDELQQVDRYHRLCREGHGQRPRQQGQQGKEDALKGQNTPGVTGTGGPSTLDLLRHGSHEVTEHGTTPRRRRRVPVTRPVSVVGVVVLGGEVTVENRTQGGACEPPGRGARFSVPELVGGNDARSPVVQPGRHGAHQGHGRQPVNGKTPQQHADHEQHGRRMQVNDDVVRSTFLQRVGGLRSSQQQIQYGIDEEQQHQRAGHPPTAHEQAGNSDRGGQQTPQVRHPRPTHASRHQ